MSIASRRCFAATGKLAVVVLFAIPTGAFARPASSRPARQYTIEQFMAATSIRGASFSADEKRILFSSNKTGIFHLFSVSISGGEPLPLTTSTTDSTFAVSYFPKDDRVLSTRDEGGNEQNHLYVRAADGAERDLTPGEK